MIQTLEAVVDEKGKINLLSDVRLKKGRRALVTVLDENQKLSRELSVRTPTNEVVNDDDVLGLWASRKETSSEIARTIRGNNRKAE